MTEHVPGPRPDPIPDQSAGRADDPRGRFAAAPVAALTTVNAQGAPHVVPVVFALAVDASTGDGREDVVYTAVDGKPKSTRRLARLANVSANPRVSLLVDHYEADWSRLWWVRADGVAVVHEHGDAMAAGYAALRAKYPQYAHVALDGPVLAITVGRWASWHG